MRLPIHVVSLPTMHAAEQIAHGMSSRLQCIGVRLQEDVDVRETALLAPVGAIMPLLVQSLVSTVCP